MDTQEIEMSAISSTLRNAGRVAAVEALKSGDYTIGEVAERFGATTISVRKWNKIADEKGIDALKHSAHNVHGVAVDYRTLPIGLRDAGRIAAVETLNEGEFGVSAVAEMFSTTTISLRKWKKIADEKGIEALHEQKRGRLHKVAE